MRSNATFDKCQPSNGASIIRLVPKNGWIKLHRKLLECPELRGNHKAFTVWVHLLLRANHEQTENLDCGELWITQRQFASECCVSRQEMRTILKIFQSFGMISLVSTTINPASNPASNPAATRITICKYMEFQRGANSTNPASNPASNPAASPPLKNPPLYEKKIQESKKKTPNGVYKESRPSASLSMETPSTIVWKDGFAEFYAAYPRKVAPQKAATAYRQALKVASHEEIMDGLCRAVLCWKRNATDRTYIPHPTTWLHGGRWADELFDGPKANGAERDPWINAARDLLRQYAESEDDADPFQPRACDSLFDQITGLGSYAMEN